MPNVRISTASPVDLGDQVVIGFCDIAGAGCRVAMAVGAGEGMEAQALDLIVEGAQAWGAVGWGDAAGASPPALAARTFTRGGKAVCSVVVVNTAPPAGEESALCAALIDFVTTGAAPTVVLAAAVKFPTKVSGEGARLVLLNGAEAPAGAVALPPFPADAPVQDAVVASFAHHAAAAALPVAGVVVPGYRVKARDAGGPGAEAVATLGAAVAEAAGLKFDAAAAAAMVPETLWYAGAEDGTADFVYR